MLRHFAGLAAALCATVALSAPAQADIYAFEGTIFVGVHQNSGLNFTGRGRQTLQDITIGLDFSVVAEEIVITAGGVWDDNRDGLASDHTFLIHDTNTEEELASMVLPAGEGGLLHEGYRYHDLTQPLLLPQGSDFTVSVHYPVGNGDSNGNSGRTDQALEPTPLFLAGDNNLVNIGGGRFGLGIAFPSIADTGPQNRYHGPSFAFYANPEPGTLVLVAGVAAAGFALRRRRRRKLELDANA